MPIGSLMMKLSPLRVGYEKFVVDTLSVRFLVLVC